MWGTTYAHCVRDDPHTPRDQLVLETISKILLQVKILLAQVGETNSELERIIQKAQYVSIELREKFIFKQFKITSE